MPTINAFYSNDNHRQQLNEIISELKEFAAKELTCTDIALRPDEVSIRLIKVEGSGMLAELELKITAHAFGSRIERQDEICLRIREFVKGRLDLPEVRVWLLLPQLGHSWE